MPTRIYRKRRVASRRTRRVGRRGRGFFDSLWSGIKDVARPIAKIAGPLVGAYNPVAGSIMSGIAGLGRRRRVGRPRVRRTTVRRTRRTVRPRVRRTTVRRTRRVTRGRGIFSSLWKKIKPVLTRAHASVKQQRVISNAIGNNTLGRVVRTLGYGRRGRGSVRMTMKPAVHFVRF